MRLTSSLNQMASLLAGVALFAMALTGTVDIVGGLAGRPLPGAYEFTETLMVIVIFFGFAKAEEQKKHIAVELLVQRLRPRTRIAFTILATLLSAFLFALIAYFGWLAASRSIATGEFQAGQIHFPLWPARLALALGATIMVLQCLKDITGDFLTLVHGTGRAS